VARKHTNPRDALDAPHLDRTGVIGRGDRRSVRREGDPQDRVGASSGTRGDRARRRSGRKSPSSGYRSPEARSRWSAQSRSDSDRGGMGSFR
jgi:hypothetical protein